jgi:hypothetical protein
MMEVRQQGWQGRRDHDQFRRRGDLEQGAVEIEEQRGFPVQLRRRHSARSPCALID